MKDRNKSIIYNKELYIQHIKDNYKKSKNSKIYTDEEIENYRLTMINHHDLFCFIIDNDIKYENMTKDQKECYDDGPGTEIDYIRSLGYEAN